MAFLSTGSFELTAISNGIYPICGLGMPSTTASALVLSLARFFTWVSVYHGSAVKPVHLTRIIVGPTFIGPLQGYLLDNAKWSRKSRARVAVVSFTILTLLTCTKRTFYIFFICVLCWISNLGIYGLVVQYQYDKQTTIIDITDPVFIKSCLLFILYGLIENSAMVTGYWIIGKYT